uniref:Uncharacterized protein n=1 Tax=Steinernema glaseri TaxID=37863 RepID=A0A1I8AK14_9BILA
MVIHIPMSSDILGSANITGGEVTLGHLKDRADETKPLQKHTTPKTAQLRDMARLRDHAEGLQWENSFRVIPHESHVLPPRVYSGMRQHLGDASGLLSEERKCQPAYKGSKKDNMVLRRHGCCQN